MSQNGRSPALLLVGITTGLALLGLALPGLLGASSVLTPEQSLVWLSFSLPVLGLWAIIAIVWVITWRRRRDRGQA